MHYWELVKHDSHVAFAELDVDLCVIKANSRMAAILGQQSDQLVDQHLLDIIRESDRRNLREIVNKVKDTQRSCGLHMCWLTCSSQEVWAVGTVIPARDMRDTVGEYLLVACEINASDASDEADRQYLLKQNEKLRDEVRETKRMLFDIAMEMAKKESPSLKVDVAQTQQNTGDDSVNQAGDNDANIN